MASSLNKVTLIGNLGKDPEIRSTSDGREIATFSIATTEYWKDKATGEKKERTEWHKIVLFSEGLVSVAKQYLKKGSKVYLEGQLSTRKWVDNNNQERYTTEIILQGYQANLVMLDNKNDNNNLPGNATQATPQNFHNNEIDDDGIPF
jgi:single-strand DNA-binding protein